MRTSVIKSIGALALTAAGTAFVFGFRTSDSVLDTTAIADTGTTSSSPTSGSSPSTTSTTAGSSGSSAAAESSGSSTPPGSPTASPAETTDSSAAAYADGRWTGQAVSEPWGAFQVQV